MQNMSFYRFLERLSLDGRDSFQWIPTRLARMSAYPFGFPVEKGKYNRYAIFTNKFNFHKWTLDPSEILKIHAKNRKLSIKGLIPPDAGFLLPFVVTGEWWEMNVENNDREVEGILVYREKSKEISQDAEKGEDPASDGGPRTGQEERPDPDAALVPRRAEEDLLCERIL